ncbi:unnamed protein product [Enterobius vermicularis]|uniref:Fatty-acid and retinol-binding protein 1 n=1 Tax=Enterobius vermicularis TaxID=51028 RepID=A0A0N4VBI3_ENTVE|nr:unnamed protein product [Enterobius vermicularis]
MNFSLADNSFFDTIKESSQNLFLKLTGIKDTIDNGLKKLSPEAFEFMEDLIRRFLAIFAGHNVGAITVGLSDFLKDTLGIYDKLSENAKQDLMREFPTISDLLTSDVSRLLISRASDISAGAEKIIEALLPKKTTDAPAKDTVGEKIDINTAEADNDLNSGKTVQSVTKSVDTHQRPDTDNVVDLVNEKMTKIDVNV